MPQRVTPKEASNGSNVTSHPQLRLGQLLADLEQILRHPTLFIPRCAPAPPRCRARCPARTETTQGFTPNLDHEIRGAELVGHLVGAADQSGDQRSDTGWRYALFTPSFPC